MRCSMTGTTTSAPARCSAMAASVASGSNCACTTAVDDIPSPTPRWTRPHAWNSGAAMTTVSRARIGTTSSSGVNESTPLALPRAAPFGRPVVPDVRITWRPTWRDGVSGTIDGSRPSARSSLPPIATAAPASATISANTSSWRIVSTPSWATTSASWGPANPVLRYTMSAPTLVAATRLSTKTRPLRARIPTVLPGPTPRARSSRPMPSVARHSWV